VPTFALQFIFPKSKWLNWILGDPVSVAVWYGRQFGWHVRRSEDKPPHTHFLADSSGQVMVEIYNNPAAQGSINLYFQNKN
jgi:hypothetical protein